MAKTASQRRATKRAQRFAVLSETANDKFARALQLSLQGWVTEARARARKFTRNDDCATALKAFDVVHLARQQLAGVTCQREAQQVAAAIEVLEHECAKAIALAAGVPLTLSTQSLVAEIERRRLRSFGR